jgi:hypothetical protein
MNLLLKYAPFAPNYAGPALRNAASTSHRTTSIAPLYAGNAHRAANIAAINNLD